MVFFIHLKILSKQKLKKEEIILWIKYYPGKINIILKILINVFGLHPVLIEQCIT
jgi:hypothetical protein